MSHFAVAVIVHDNGYLDDLLAPYQENNMGDCPEQYLKFVSTEEEHREEYENHSTDKIRTPEVSMGASDVSAIPFVREKLVDMQRKLAESKNVIMDGRDIGTCVLPDAEVKIFLTASSEVRAKRRFDELLEKGEIVTFEEVLNDIIVRDRNDETRAVSPLKKADDAVVLDTSNLSFEESQKAVIKIIEDKMKEGF